MSVSLEGIVIFSSDSETEGRKKQFNLTSLDSDCWDSDTDEAEEMPLVDLKKHKLKLRKHPESHNRANQDRGRGFRVLIGCTCLGLVVFVAMVFLGLHMVKNRRINEITQGSSPPPLPNLPSERPAKINISSSVKTNSLARLGTGPVIHSKPIQLPNVNSNTEERQESEKIVTPKIVPERVDCHPEKNPSLTVCEERGCLWDGEGAPNCYYPESIGYRIIDPKSITPMTGANEGELLLAKVGHASPYSPDVKNVKFTYSYVGAEGILNFKFVDSERERYEVPIELWPDGKPQGPVPEDKPIKLWVPRPQADTFSFQIYRSSSETEAVLWDSKPEGLIFSDQFLQIATRVPTNNVYGFGENSHPTFKRDFSEYRTWSLFAWSGNPMSKELSYRNLYGVHPFYMCVEPDGKAHGVFFLNSNAQEYSITPGNQLVYRTIGGVLDFYMFPGPTPRDVVRQYWSLIGRPMMPPYWSLGFQLCKYGYKNTDEIKETVERTKKYGIPHDVQYVDIDYMDGKRDFTVDEENFGGLADYVKSQQKDGMKWVFILDPAISVGPWTKEYRPFSRGKEMNVYITWPNDVTLPAINSKYETTKGTRIMLGTVWPDDSVAFPDWLRPNTTVWWSNELKKFRVTLSYDGIWIDMNEPTNFHTNHPNPKQYDFYKTKSEPLICPDNQWENPPYPTKALEHKDALKLSYLTVCMVGNQFDANKSYMHYDVHNLYGHTEAIATKIAIEEATGKRSFILTRSTFVGSGRFAAHWLGDNHALWEDMRASVIGSLEFSMFGIPMVGADICGFGLNTTEELCLRWSQLGAFYPFSRNHNNLYEADQDPGIWSSVAAAAKKALDFRYTYLPYLYTLFYQAHSFGKNLLNPMVFEFPHDPIATTVDQQFLWGECLLITPVLYPGVDSVRGYFPNGTWYSMVGVDYGLPIKGPKYLELSAKLTEMIPVHVKTGCILPRQKAANNTAFSRKNPVELLLAIDKERYAQGYLFWDDGDQLYEKDRWRRWYVKFAYQRTKMRERTKNVLTLEILNSPHPTEELKIPNLTILEIFGLEFPPDFESFRLNGVGLTGIKEKFYSDASERMFFSAEPILEWSELPLNRKSVLTWADST